MRRMFASATLKLTAWYLIILLAISLLFSFLIFELSTAEISNRLERLQIRAEGSTRTLTLPGPVTLNDVRVNQTQEARTSIFFGLLYMNLAVVGLGGIGSYLLARRTLRPIEEAHEAQSRFASDASHELRTPLAVMKSEIQVAMRDPKMKASEYRELLISNLEEVDKLTELSQALLQLSRLDYGDLERSDRVDIAVALRKAAKTVKISPKRLELSFPDRPVPVDGNESTLNELFCILFDNAVKYSPADSTIRVNLTSNGRNCRIAISNHGVGIEADEIPKVFDRFYRAAKTRSTLASPSGYGLGLSLAKKIVTLHEGVISVASKPGTITIFTIVLPQVRKNR